MENLNQIDDMVCEYLLFRGFTNTFKSFEDDREHDKIQGFNVDKIVTKLFQQIDLCNYKDFHDTWDFLNSRFFCLLDATYVASVDSLLDSLQKLFIVTCIRKGKPDEVRDFFTIYCPDILSSSIHSEKNDDWRRWCSLPYVRNPEKDSYFNHYFSASWSESLRESLMNFLHAIFQNLSPPSLLGIGVFKTERQRSQAQIKAFKSEIAFCHQEVQQAKENYANLAQILRDVSDCVSSSRPDSLQNDLQAILSKVPVSQLTDPELNNLSDSSDLRQTLSRQTSLIHSPQEDDVHIQSLTISQSEEVGVFSEGINCCKWSRDGHRFATGGGEGILSVYNYDSETQKSELFSSYTCGSELLCIDWGYARENSTSNGNLILYGTQEGGLGILNAASNNALRESIVDGVSSVIAVNFSPVMNAYCSSVLSKETSLIFWDFLTNDRVLEFSLGNPAIHVNCIEYIPTGNGVFCGCSDGHVRLFDVRSNKVVSDEKVSSEAISGLKLLVNSQAEGTASLLTCSVDGVLREHDFRNLTSIILNILNEYVVCQYPLRKSVTTTAIPRSDIVYSPSTRLLGVAANHIEGLSLFSRGESTQIVADGIGHLSYNLDICPTQSTIIAGTTDCTLEMLSFSTL